MNRQKRTPRRLNDNRQKTTDIKSLIVKSDKDNRIVRIGV